MSFARIIFVGLFTAAIFCLWCTCGCHSNKIVNHQSKDTCSVLYIWDDSLSSKYYALSGGIHIDGVITTPEIAVQIAELVLKPIYGTEKIEDEKPFLVNLENDIWLIEGYGDKDRSEWIGGGVYIEIDKRTGKILKILHGK